MRNQIKLLLVLTLVGFVLLSGCTQEKPNCIKSKGKLVGFSNNCVDSCDYVRGDVQVCGQILTPGCDCGLEMCWNGTSCEPN